MDPGVQYVLTLLERTKNVLSLPQKVTDEYQKSFDFPKQHATVHTSDDLLNKGAAPGYSTRMGEGTHQESRELYVMGNKKNVDEQVESLNMCSAPLT